jgi:hypothetical protein
LDGTDNTESANYQDKEAIKEEKELIDPNDESEGTPLDNSDGHNKLVQMVVKLNFWDEFLKCQFEGIHLDFDGLG